MIIQSIYTCIVKFDSHRDNLMKIRHIFLSPQSWQRNSSLLCLRELSKVTLPQSLTVSYSDSWPSALSATVSVTFLDSRCQELEN